MKLHRIIALPFAAVADLATLGNFGDEGYIEGILNAEKRDQRREQEWRELERAANIIATLESAKHEERT